jgi:hypothetical protein
MHAKIHLPRESEGAVKIQADGDIVIKPRFFKKIGWVPLFHMTLTDANKREDNYVVMVSAATKYIKVEKLVEVVPQCDEELSIITTEPINEETLDE